LAVAGRELASDCILIDAIADKIIAKKRGYCPHKPHQKQKEFLELVAPEALYGGAAGGGKSDALLMAALEHVDKPGYSALILRRTFRDLNQAGAIMDRAHHWLRGTDASWNSQAKRFRFPSGATLTFGYFDSEGDKTQYASAEFQFCPEVGTLIVMADGSRRAVETIRPGELVLTLEGPRPVTHTHPPTRKPCVRVLGKDIDMVVSAGHVFLGAKGWEAVPSGPRPKESREPGSTLARSRQTSSDENTLPSCSRSSPEPCAQHDAQYRAERVRPENGASSANEEIDCEESGDCTPEPSRPRPWSGLVRLCEPDLLLSVCGCVDEVPQRGPRSAFATDSTRSRSSPRTGTRSCSRGCASPWAPRCASACGAQRTPGASVTRG
jgi:hypothetical protein